jgi:hypothetical protein
MGYYIDLSTISIGEYKTKLEESDLLPSRIILKEDINERFNRLENQGIKTVYELQQALKTKKKLQGFSTISGLPEAYLTILIREVNSLHPKPNKLRDFPDLSEDMILRLEKEGIKNTLQLFDKVVTQESRRDLGEQTGINEKDILELTKLTDLSRIRWTGAVFARLLFESGYDTVEKVSRADYEKLYETLIQINQAQKYTKGKFGLNDIKLCADAANDVPFEIEY